MSKAAHFAILMSAYPNAGLPDPLSETGFPDAENIYAESCQVGGTAG
jgi:hypothetical protein